MVRHFMWTSFFLDWRIKVNDKIVLWIFTYFSISDEKIKFKEQRGGRSFIDTNKKNQNENIKELNTISLNDLFSKNNMKEIDYLSIDTEGTEFEILKSLNFEIYRPKVITIEHIIKIIEKNI